MVRTLHSYLTKQVLITVFMAVTVFTFVLFLGNALKEILPLLVNGQVTFVALVKAILLLFPFVMVFALPMGMLTATLLVFGRFSADQELTAVRAGGVSLVALVTPILLLSLAFSAVCALFNLKVAPESRVAYKNLLYSIGAERAATLLPEDQFVDDIPGYVIYTRKRDGDLLRDVQLYQLQSNQVTVRVSAPEGRIFFDAEAQTIRLKLDRAIVETRMSPAEANADPNPDLLAPLDSMNSITNWPDTEQLATAKTPPALQQADPQRDRWHSIFTTFETELQLASLAATAKKPKLTDMTFWQLRSEIARLQEQGIDPTPAAVQLHRQISFSFASFGFTLIGIPLGIRAHRRETSAGVAIALMLLLVYYSFFVVGQALETRAEFGPQFLLWVPNFLFQAMGAVLLWRANRT